MNKKVLVIDDEREISEIIKTVLEEKGARVEINFTPHDIKKQIAKFKPDILFVDYKIPGIKAEEIITSLKKTKIKIILTSGTSDIVKIGQKLGVKVLAKPFDIDTLTQLLLS
jgi:two-component system response regulator VicR